MKSQYDVYMCRESKEMLHYRKIARRKLILAGRAEPETDEEKMFLKVAKAVYSDKTDIYKYHILPSFTPAIVDTSAPTKELVNQLIVSGWQIHYDNEFIKPILVIVATVIAWVCLYVFIY
jgi:hypothetical protein